MLLKSLFLFLLFGLAHSVPNPKWKDVYSVKGVLYIPYAELTEPFYAWYDNNAGRSRIDYYGGMVKTYQLTKKVAGGYGVSLKVAPVTTELQVNSQTCLQVNGSDEFSIDVQSILPDLSKFKYNGKDMIDGEDVEKWTLSDINNEKTNKYSMWIKYKYPSAGPKNPIAIPVRYEMRGYNTLLGSHYDHYYLEYQDYDITENIPEEIFTVDSNMKCIGFPGPGVQHIYTFNPMREFVHPTTTDHVDHEFSKFVTKHNKNYDDKKEHITRKDVFRQNMRYITSKNRANLGYSLTVNHLTDRTDIEMRALRGKQYTTSDNGASPFPYHKDQLKAIKLNLPESFDWRIYGAVNPVRDQSVCGSCWSFGTIGSIEGAFFLHNGGHLMSLSQQALVDCSWGYGNNGCDGGEDFRAYQWMMKHGGIPLDDEYGGYLGQDGYCHTENVTLVAPIKGYVNVTANDPNALRLAIFKHGPISVAIDASHRSFSFYSHGVYFEPQCKNKLEDLDHAVVAIGYGSIGGKDYWLIRNSWSNYWGNDGYALMSAENNNCGVETTPTYVVM